MSRPLLEARNLRRAYARRGLGFGPRGSVVAVDGVDFCVGRGESAGVVGESGSGKSTLARLLLALERPDTGYVDFAGHRISHLPSSRLRPLRRRFQAVFQDPVTSLNPRLSVATIIEEPLVAHGIGDRRSRATRVQELLRMVGLPSTAARRRPGAFSGGERQRIAIARALAPEPDLVVLDEPLTALDVVVQNQILGLLRGLRRKLELSMILVSHDLTVVHAVCDRVVVMYRGVVVEHGPAATVLENPCHPYTQLLIDAAPELNAETSLADKPPTTVEWPAAGCRFAARCAHADRRCRVEPPLFAAGSEHRSACWLSDRGDEARDNDGSGRR